MVHGEIGAPELLDREVVHAEGAHPTFDEHLRRARGHVREVALELGGVPPLRVVGKADEDVPSCERGVPDVVRVDRGPPTQVPDQRIADHAVERHLAELRPVGEEVVRRIDVRTRVAPEGEQRQVAYVALRDPPDRAHLGNGIARVDVLAGAVRHRDVYDAPWHAWLPQAARPKRAASPGSLPRPARPVATSAATRSASSRLRWSAMLRPAMSKAVPCPVEVRISGRPISNVTTRPNPTSLTAISP